MQANIRGWPPHGTVLSSLGHVRVLTRGTCNNLMDSKREYCTTNSALVAKKSSYPPKPTAPPRLRRVAKCRMRYVPDKAPCGIAHSMVALLAQLFTVVHCWPEYNPSIAAFLEMQSAGARRVQSSERRQAGDSEWSWRAVSIIRYLCRESPAPAHHSRHCVMKGNDYQ